eukprot:45717_1
MTAQKRLEEDTQFMQECTFQPKIIHRSKNKASSDPAPIPSFDEAVMRSRGAFRERTKLRQKLDVRAQSWCAEYDRRMEALEKQRAMGIYPNSQAPSEIDSSTPSYARHSISTAAKSRTLHDRQAHTAPAASRPLLYVDVNMGRGKLGRIALYPNDDPAKVARNFARMYSISKTMTSRLTQLLQSQLSSLRNSSMSPEESRIGADIGGASDVIQIDTTTDQKNGVSSTVLQTKSAGLPLVVAAPLTPVSSTLNSSTLAELAALSPSTMGFSPNASVVPLGKFSDSKPPDVSQLSELEAAERQLEEIQAHHSFEFLNTSTDLAGLSEEDFSSDLNEEFVVGGGKFKTAEKSRKMAG